MDWTPSPVGAERDLTMLADRMRSALMTLLGAAYDQEPPAMILTALEFAPTEDLTHPEVFDWYRRLRKSVASAVEAERDAVVGDWDRVLSLVAASRDRAKQNSQRLGAAFDLENQSESVAAALDRAGRFATDSTGVASELSPVIVTDEVVSGLAIALAELRSVWPEFAQEFEQCVECIVVFDGNAAIGFADFEFHNTVFLKVGYIVGADVTPTSIAEEIVHEASHVRLNSAIGGRPFFANPDGEYYESPLRRDPRPMFGVFQQMYVLRRLKEFNSRKLRDEPSLKDYWDAEGRAIDESLAEALAVVVQHAQLTPDGEALVRSISESIEPRIPAA